MTMSEWLTLYYHHIETSGAGKPRPGVLSAAERAELLALIEDD